MLVLFNQIPPAQFLKKKKKAIQFPEDVTKSEEIIFIFQVKNLILNILVNDNIKSRYLIWCARIVSVMIQQVPSRSK